MSRRGAFYTQVEFANDAEEISALGVLQAKSDIRDSRSEVGFNIRNARLHSEDDYHVALTTLAKQGRLYYDNHFVSESHPNSQKERGLFVSQLTLVARSWVTRK